MTDFAIKVLTSKLGNTYLFSVGQAGYIVKSKTGKLLGIDLYLSDCVERVEGNIGFKRLQPKILNSFDLKFDVLITTHPHRDHFDIDSIPELMSNSNTKLFASVNCFKDIKNLSIPDKNVKYVTPGESAVASDFYIDFVNCDHGTSAPDAFGIVVSVDGKKIYFSGDTCLRLDRVNEYINKGPFDVMVAPINGAYGNLNENECAELSGALNPKITIPSHFGMFAYHGGNPGLFIDIMNEKYPNNNYFILTMGEGMTI